METKATDTAFAKRESLTELLGQLAGNSAALVRDEIQLVIQRTKEAGSALANGAALAAVGAVFILGGFLSLCAALIIRLTEYMTADLAAVATGGGLALLGLLFVLLGYGRIKKSMHTR